MGVRTDKETYNGYMRDYNRVRLPIIKSQIFDLLGRECANCELDDMRVLEIDHINGGGRQARKNTGSLNYYTKILREIEDGSDNYRVLCKNCNWLAFKHDLIL